MTVNRIAVDGLWRCLCPSFDSIVLSQSTRPLARPSKPFPRSKARTAAFPKCRQFSTTVPTHNEAEGPRIRFHVTKPDAPDTPHRLGVKKSWARIVPVDGGLEGDGISAGHSTTGVDFGEGNRILKKGKLENAVYGLTGTSPLRRSGKHEESEIEERDKSSEDSAHSAQPPTSRRNTRGGKMRVNLWGLGQPKQEDDELAKKLQESFQRVPDREVPGRAHSLRILKEPGRANQSQRTKSSETVLSSHNANPVCVGKPAELETDVAGQVQSLRILRDSGGVNQSQKAKNLETALPSHNAKTLRVEETRPDKSENGVNQAKLPQKLFSFIQNAVQAEDPPNSRTKESEERSRGSPRTLWVPHREYGGDSERVTASPTAKESIFTQQSPVPKNSREAFFQTIRDQRQQLAAQQPLPRHQESTESPAFFRPVQKLQQESERKSVVVWEQDKWDGDEIEFLHDRLRSYRTQEGNYGRVVGLVEYLVKVRGEEPALIHYESLIRANADAENGSAECVRTLLEEMREEGIRGDSGLYHGALQALAIHPDYALRADIMQEMKERWFGLSPEGWHSLVVGLLRDRQVEMALDKLEQMHSDDIHIQPWLYDIFTYLLCELGEMDEAYKLVRHRYENSRLGITQDHWHYLLDQFSSAYYYEATKEIWDSHVRSSELVPSDGTCVAVLNLAARNADPALATSVIQILSARKTPLSPFHYEALVAAYTGIEDIKTAFRVLAIMEKAGHDPSASSTRPLYLYLITSDQLCHEAWNIVTKLHRDGHAIPVTAVNVIIESLNKLGKFDAAFEYYKRLHEVCPRGPNTESIDVALQGLGRAPTGGKARAMFLASEMQALDIKPDILTYDRLILICLKEDEYEDAFRYLEEMEEVGRESVENDQMGWWMRRGTAAAMVRVCAVSGDDRAWKIMEGMRERGMSIVKLKEWAKVNWEKHGSRQAKGMSVAKG